MKRFLAFDIGASSGRAIVGLLENDKLVLDEIYRFPNFGIKIDHSIYWNLLNIYSEILEGLKMYVKKYGNQVDGIGIDTWGVDFVLLDKNDELVGLSHHYRDIRTEGMLTPMFEKISKEEIFKETGIQFMELNSSTQLFSLVIRNSPQFTISKSFLMIPDYLNYLLSGIKCSEYTIATTSQLINHKTLDWSKNVIEKLGLDLNLFQKIIHPGTLLGRIKNNIAKEVGIKQDTNIIAPACHDSACAVAAVPVDMRKYKKGEWAYLSSGTWSLLGIELDKPLINNMSLEYNLTNEGGVENTIRFLKNVTGLWIVQECKKLWEYENLDLTWEEIVSSASDAKAFQFFINPDNPIFYNPPNMIQAIQDYCQKTHQHTPKEIGEISRTIFESLAFRYRQVIENLECMLNKKIKILFIIGGGSSNRLLNQFTANSLHIPVQAGPIEATAIGNILVQAKTVNIEIELDKLREIVRSSFPIADYTPHDENRWNIAYKNYLQYI